MNALLLICPLVVLLSSLGTNQAFAVPGLANSPSETAQETNPLAPETQNFEELLIEAQTLLFTGRPIDARAKLQAALALRPKDFRPHMFLGHYYLFEVGHFKLAFRYIKTAEQLFREEFGSDDFVSPEKQGEHGLLLYLLSEAHLNLDQYEESLKTLDRFERRYMRDWYPGTRAWVLMKLKRIDEAIAVAQAGLLANADPRRTWNILGILLSVKDNRELSLSAFAEAIKAEMSLTGSGQIATPLNNAGEVYRELFQDDLAEASWVKAIRLPDGCEHILPSLNLAILYVDQLRLKQAERALADFEACYAQQPERKDTEHRTLLALARGRIALHANNLEQALALLTIANDDQQWFGKIGTNQNDVEFASTVALADALTARSSALRDTVRDSLWEELRDVVEAPVLEMRAQWLRRKARRIALEELGDFEDLIIRNTDTMIEYPTLGGVLKTLNPKSLTKRLERLEKTDSRLDAKTHYLLYQGISSLEHGKRKDAISLLETAYNNFRDFDRLGRAEALAHILLALPEFARWWKFWDQDEAQARQRLQRLEELYRLLPSTLRFYDLQLPVSVRLETTEDTASAEILRLVKSRLLQRRFTVAPPALSDAANFQIVLSASPGSASSGKSEVRRVSLHLLDKQGTLPQVVVAEDVEGRKVAKLVNAFIERAFAPSIDPPGLPQREVPILR